MVISTTVSYPGVCSKTSVGCIYFANVSNETIITYELTKKRPSLGEVNLLGTERFHLWSSKPSLVNLTLFYYELNSGRFINLPVWGQYTYGLWRLSFQRKYVLFQS